MIACRTICWFEHDSAKLRIYGWQRRHSPDADSSANHLPWVQSSACKALGQESDAARCTADSRWCCACRSWKEMPTTEIKAASAGRSKANCVIYFTTIELWTRSVISAANYRWTLISRTNICLTCRKLMLLNRTRKGIRLIDAGRCFSLKLGVKDGVQKDYILSTSLPPEHRFNWNCFDGRSWLPDALV